MRASKLSSLYDANVSSDQFIVSKRSMVSERTEINRRQGQSSHIDSIEIEYQNLKASRIQKLSRLYDSDYRPAKYEDAVEFKNKRSYLKKIGENQYESIGLFQNTKELLAFGLGPYFLIQYMRRTVWLFFFFSLAQAVRIYINSSSNGLGDYSISFSTFLIMTTMGNFTGPVLTEIDAYIMTIIPGLFFVAFGIWLLIWKRHYYAVIIQKEQSSTMVYPQKFCVQIDIEDKQIQEEDLVKLFNHFGQVYQVSLVRRHKNKLCYFQELQQLDTKIKETELEIMLGQGLQDELKNLRTKRDELYQQIKTMKINPKMLSAYIHFQYEQSKVNLLAFYKDHYLFDSAWHACLRSLCCCFIKDVPNEYKLNGQPLLLKSEIVPSPEDINWESRQISHISKFFRILFGIFIIVIFLILSCAILGLCSVYASGNSIDCQFIHIPVTTAEALSSNQTEQQKRCFCNANLFQSYNDQSIGAYCGSMINTFYTEQSIQWAVVATQQITNFLFSLIVPWIINLIRLQSFSSGIFVETIVYMIFMIINSVIIPLLIYANIFGFKTAQYLSFVTVISSDFKQFLNVENIEFQADFNTIWYRNVSPIFANFIVVEIILTWINFIRHKCASSTIGLQKSQGKILQKHMNQKITSFKFDLSGEYAQFNLVIVMGTLYSAGCPALIPLTFICLFSKYVYARSLIQNNSSQIQGLTEHLQTFTFFLIPILLFASTLVGSWMLTANQAIYPDKMKAGFTIGIDQEILNRQLYLPWLIITAVCAALIFFLYNSIVRFFYWIFQRCRGQKNLIHPSASEILPFSQYAKKLNILCSYNIRNNDKYKNVIINLEKFLLVENK